MAEYRQTELPQTSPFNWQQRNSNCIFMTCTHSHLVLNNTLHFKKKKKAPCQQIFFFVEKKNACKRCHFNIRRPKERDADTYETLWRVSTRTQQRGSAPLCLAFFFILSSFPYVKNSKKTSGPLVPDKYAKSNNLVSDLTQTCVCVI